MSKNKDLENADFLNFKKEQLDPISSSFCAAKWYNATIWLNSGKTASCHHVPSHKIPLNKLKSNPSIIHNTNNKKEQREKMLKGIRPKGCNYCWSIEDRNDASFSDRIFKSIIYKYDEINDCKKIGSQTDVELKTLEVSFDRTCNFGCAYCNSTYSTKWSQDLAKNGSYKGLLHKDASSYKIDTSKISFDDNSEDNPYVKAFWEWWPKLENSLQEFRITGGEPLLSSNFWKVFDVFEKNSANKMVLALNTNLGARDELINKLIKKSKLVNNFDLYTSCESVGDQAEYARDGLNYDKFLDNLEKCIVEGNFRIVHIMMTVSTLCLFSITSFLDKVLILKEKYGSEKGTFSLNILHYPEFLSAKNLPKHLKVKCSNDIENWLEKHRNSYAMLAQEVTGLERLIDFLREEDKLSTKKLTLNRNDLKSFLVQYDLRRGKSYKKVFPGEFTDWLDSIGKHKKIDYLQNILHLCAIYIIQKLSKISSLPKRLLSSR
jgi:organic radical activating enzyme